MVFGGAVWLISGLLLVLLPMQLADSLRRVR